MLNWWLPGCNKLPRTQRVNEELPQFQHRKNQMTRKHKKLPRMQRVNEDKP